MSKLISVVIPAFNEEAGILSFYKNLRKHLPKGYEYELIFIDDGSRDSTLEILQAISDEDKDVRVLALSRNFGKEAATTAGIAEAHGDATLIMDSDGQHPVELIRDFIRKWESGFQVVVGIRSENQKEGFVKKYGSKVFYKILNSMSEEKLIPGSTDFRLIDKEVRNAFVHLSERSRITRALIDWLGYRRAYISFVANAREHGQASYSTNKLIKLAMNSFVSLTTLPLYISMYLGLVITPLSALAGVVLIIEQYVMGDPLNLRITGSASLGILLVFLVGVILICQGLVALYVSRMYEELKSRPLYVISSTSSRNRDTPQTPRSLT